MYACNVFLQGFLRQATIGGVLETLVWAYVDGFDGEAQAMILAVLQARSGAPSTRS